MTASDDRERVIGKVTSVTADRFVVELLSKTDNFTVVGFDDIHYVAQLGSFVMVTVGADYLVAEITGLWQKDPSARQTTETRSSTQASSSNPRFLELVPVGILPRSGDGNFAFGVSTYPALYADALYALDRELDRIFDVQNAVEPIPDSEFEALKKDWDLAGLRAHPTRFKALTVGQSVIFQGYDVKVKVDEFFGGHVAVLGNTGSGKSCTVATIIQSLFDKPDEFAAERATFVLFDVNGEYRRAFCELPDPIRRRFVHVSIDPKADAPSPSDDGEDTATFRLPHWFMSVEEWELLLRASERTQQPVLRTALGLTSLFAENGADIAELQNHILASCIRQILRNDASSPSKKDTVTALLASFHTDEINMDLVRDDIAVAYGELADPEGLSEKLEGYVVDNVTMPDYRNKPFNFGDLEKALNLALLYEEAHGNNQIRDYCAQLLTRFKWVKERDDFGFLRQVVDDLNDWERECDSFVQAILGVLPWGKDHEKSAQLIIIDMNEAEDEVVEIISSVVCRLIFEKLRAADARNSFPVNLILEEAHRYIAERPSKHAIDAARIFERAAKEGRKYGLFLTIASQRPSELSKTVLSQCSNFIVHRIQNPDDLFQVRQMTPFISESVLKRLPSLPKQHALIFGNAVNIPTTFKVRNVSPVPLSDDAEIRKLWFRPSARSD